jgi:hypothetical protein
MAGGRPKNSKQIVHTHRWLIESAIEKMGRVAVRDQLIEEIKEQGVSAILPKFAYAYPKEIDVSGSIKLDTTNIPIEMLKEVFGDDGLEGIEGSTGTVQSINSLEAPTRATN